MNKHCGACYQRQTPYIDSMIYDGVPLAEIARRTGIDRQVIGRHSRGRHMAMRRPEAPTTMKGWQLQGFATEDEWLRSIADEFSIPLGDLRAHCLAGHHLHGEPQRP